MANLILIQDFNNAAWNKRSGLAISGSQTFWDGGTAPTFVWSSGDGALWNTPASGGLTNGQLYTCSVYAKATAGSPVLQFEIWDGVSTTTANVGSLAGSTTTGVLSGSWQLVTFQWVAPRTSNFSAGDIQFMFTGGSAALYLPRVDAGICRDENLVTTIDLSSGTWGKRAGQSIGSATTAPDGTTTAYPNTWTSGDGALWCTTCGGAAGTGKTFKAGESYTFSCWIKKTSGSPTLSLNVWDGTSATTGEPTWTPGPNGWSFCTWTWSALNTVTSAVVELDLYVPSGNAVIWRPWINWGSAATGFVEQTKTLAGVSRVRQTVTKTLAGVSRVRKTVVKTLAGTVSVKKTTTKTLAGVATIAPPGPPVLYRSWFTGHHLYSYDGITWVNDDSDAPVVLSDADAVTATCYGRGLYLWLGRRSGDTNLSLAITALQGKTWFFARTNDSALGASSPIGQLVWDGSQFLLLRYDASTGTALLTSALGTSWTAKTAPFAYGTGDNKIVYGNGLYMATGADSGSFVTSYGTKTSSDLVTWSSVTALGTDGTWGVGDLAYGGGKWLLALGGGPSRLRYSTNDGGTWTACTVDANFKPGDVLYDHGVWMAVGLYTGAGAAFATSTDGITWTVNSTAWSAATAAKGISCIDGAWLVPGLVYSGTPYYRSARSTDDGANWATSDEGTGASSSFTQLAYAPGRTHSTQVGAARIGKTLLKTQQAGVTRVRKTVTKTQAGLVRTQKTAPLKTQAGLANITPNLLSHPDDLLHAVWGEVAGIATGATTTSPTGIAAAARFFTWSSGSGTVYNTTTGPLTAGQQYTASVWARRSNGSPTVTLSIWDGTTAFTSPTWTATDAWDLFTFTFTATHSVASFEFDMRLAGGNTAVWRPCVNWGTGVAGFLISTSTQAGVARIQQTTTKTQAGVVRVRKTAPLKTQAGLARIRQTSTEVLAGQVRVRKTAPLKTQAGLSRIQATTLKTQSGASRIRVTAPVVGQQGVSRIRAAVNFDLTAASRIQATASSDLTATSSILATTLQTRSGISRIQVTAPANDQHGTGRIRTTVGQNLPSVSRIRSTTLQTRSGVSRIQVIAPVVNQQGTSRIQTTVGHDLTATSRIQTTAPVADQQGTSRIRTTAPVVNQQGVCRVQVTAPASDQVGVCRIQAGAPVVNQQGTSRIHVSVGHDLTATSRVQTTTPQTQHGVATISWTVVTAPVVDQQGTSRIQTTAPVVDQQGVGRVQVTVPANDQLSTSRIQTATAVGQTAVSRVQAGVSRHIQGTARIRATTTADQSAISRLQRTGSISQSGRSRLQVHHAVIQSAISRVQQTVTRSQTGTASVSVPGTRLHTLAGTARIIRVHNTHIQNAVARLQVRHAVVLVGHARLQKTVSRSQTGTARIIRVHVTQTQNAIARLQVRHAVTQAATSRVQRTVIRSQTGTARIIRVHVTHTQNAIARLQVRHAQHQTGTAHILSTHHAQQQSGTARILASKVRTNHGVARLQVTTAQHQTGTATLVHRHTPEITATARIVATVVHHASGTTSIFGTTTHTLTGTAHLMAPATDATSKRILRVAEQNRTMQIPERYEFRVEPGARLLEVPAACRIFRAPPRPGLVRAK